MDETNKIISGRMTRRTFLKTLGTGLAAGGALSGGWLRAQPVEAAFAGTLLRGTPGGRLAQSLDQGQTWQPLANFGAQCRIAELRAVDRQIYARLTVGGHPFWLVSNDGRTWRTAA